MKIWKICRMPIEIHRTHQRSICFYRFLLLHEVLGFVEIYRTPQSAVHIPSTKQYRNCLSTSHLGPPQYLLCFTHYNADIFNEIILNTLKQKFVQRALRSLWFSPPALRVDRFMIETIQNGSHSLKGRLTPYFPNVIIAYML